MMKKYGMPNVAFKHCTRELKTNPLKSLADEIYGKNNYKIAIGYRIDEIDRMSKEWKKKRHIYPLISPFPTRKEEINKFWEGQPFRLELKSYEGNCDYCFKKHIKKLKTLITEDNNNRFEWWKNMEKECLTL